MTNTDWRADVVKRHSGIFHSGRPSYDVQLIEGALGDGWREIVERAVASLALLANGQASEHAFSIVQIKSKLGALRIYVRHGDLPAELIDGIDFIIWDAVDGSERTCDQCGALGLRRDIEGLIVVRCDEHLSRV